MAVQMLKQPVTVSLPAWQWILILGFVAGLAPEGPPSGPIEDASMALAKQLRELFEET